ncbi:unnamed protein product, partial [Durusdinium trenchii]
AVLIGAIEKQKFAPRTAAELSGADGPRERRGSGPPERGGKRGAAVYSTAGCELDEVYILNRDSAARLTISSPLEAHKSYTLVYAMVGMDVGFENPLFASIELSYEEVDKDPHAEPPQKMLTLYEMDLGLNHVTRKFADAVDHSAHALIAVPGGVDGPSGVLVCCENCLVYKKQGHPDVVCAIPRRLEMAQEKGLLIVAHATHKLKDFFFFLIQSEYGDLYKVTLTHDEDMVSEVQVKYFDTIPLSNALCVLKTGFLFAAAEFGNHALYQFQGIGTDEEDPMCTSSHPHGAQALVAFKPRALKNLMLYDEMPSLSPIIDMKVLDATGEGKPQLYAMCGRGPRASLRVLRHGLAVTEMAVSELPGKPNAVWTVKATMDSEYDRYIVVSFVDVTLVLSIGDTVEEVLDSGFLATAPSLLIQLMADDSYVQVHPTGIRHLLPRRTNEWRVPGQKRIVTAAANERQVVIALSGGEILYFEIDESHTLNEVAKRDMNYEVLCIAVQPVPENRQRASFMAVGGDPWLPMADESRWPQMAAPGYQGRVEYGLELLTCVPRSTARATRATRAKPPMRPVLPHGRPFVRRGPARLKKETKVRGPVPGEDRLRKLLWRREAVAVARGVTWKGVVPGHSDWEPHFLETDGWQGYEEKPAGSGGQAAGNTKWWHVPDARIRELLGLPTTELRTEPEKVVETTLSPEPAAEPAMVQEDPEPEKKEKEKKWAVKDEDVELLIRHLQAELPELPELHTAGRTIPVTPGAAEKTTPRTLRLRLRLGREHLLLRAREDLPLSTDGLALSSADPPRAAPNATWRPRRRASLALERLVGRREQRARHGSELPEEEPKSLKAWIESLTAIPMAHQRLIHQKHILPNGTLKELDIQDGHELLLVPKPTMRSAHEATMKRKVKKGLLPSGSRPRQMFSAQGHQVVEPWRWDSKPQLLAQAQRPHFNGFASSDVQLPNPDDSALQRLRRVDNTIRILSLERERPLKQLSAQALQSPAESVCLLEMKNLGQAEDVHSLFLSIGLSSGILIRSVVDFVTGTLSDQRSRFLGAKAVRLHKAVTRGVPAMLALSTKPWLSYNFQGKNHCTPMSYEQLEYTSSFASEQCPEGFVGISGNTLRILACERLGELFNHTVMNLSYTPRRFVPLPPAVLPPPGQPTTDPIMCGAPGSVRGAPRGVAAVPCLGFGTTMEHPTFRV